MTDIHNDSDDFVFFTKSIRIPRDKIIGVRRSKYGPEAVIETDRGLTTVIESYEAVALHLYGGDARDFAR